MSQESGSAKPPANFGISQVHLIISFKNLTSGTAVAQNIVQGAVPKNPLIRLVEFMERGMELEIPINSCAAKHSLALDVGILVDKSLENFSANVRVNAYSVLDKERASVVVALVQYDEKSWIKLKNLYGNKQENVDNIFKMMRDD